MCIFTHLGARLNYTLGSQTESVCVCVCKGPRVYIRSVCVCVSRYRLYDTCVCVYIKVRVYTHISRYTHELYTYIKVYTYIKCIHIYQGVHMNYTPGEPDLRSRVYIRSVCVYIKVRVYTHISR